MELTVISAFLLRANAFQILLTGFRNGGPVFKATALSLTG